MKKAVCDQTGWGPTGTTGRGMDKELGTAQLSTIPRHTDIMEH